MEDKRIYATEVGVSQMFQDSTETLTMEQLRKQARYLSTSAVESLALGVDKHFWFIFPHYLEKGLSWGEFTARHTPFAGINAQSTITHALGEGIYMGTLTGLPEGVKNHVFRDGTDSVVAFWSEGSLPLVLGTGYESGVLTDIMGNEGTVVSDQGNFALVSGPDIQYLRLQGDVGGLTAPYYSQSFEPRTELTPAERIVLTQRYPDAGSEKAKAKGYLLDKTAVTNIQVEVYNFNAVPMTGMITGSAYGGWSLSTPTQPVTVSPYSKETLVFQLAASSQGVAPVGSPVVFTGEFDGQMTSRTMTIVSSDDVTVGPSVLVPDYDQPGLWDNNVSSGSTMVKHSPEPGVIQFDLQMGDGDRWAYPNFVLPENISFAGTEGVVFDVYFPAAIPGVLVRSFMYESNGSSYFTQAGMSPTGGWQQFKMSWSDFNAFGGVPDDNFHLDPEEIRSFSLGINTSTEKNISFQVKNLGVYTQPDTGLYSKLSDLQPANGQEVTAGMVDISVNLVQGEIPVQQGTVQVLADKIPVAYHTDGELIRATAQLAAGSHEIMVKAFDVNGRLLSVKSTVTVAAAEPEEPGAGGSGTEPGIEHPDTEAPSAPVLSLESRAETALTVNWTAAADNTGVSGYALLLDGGEVPGAAAAAAVAGNVYRYTVSGLAADTGYSLQVKVWDQAGNESLSNRLEARTAAVSSESSAPSDSTDSTDSTESSNTPSVPGASPAASIPANEETEVLSVLPEHLRTAGDLAVSLTLPQGKTRLELGKELFGKLDGKALKVEAGKNNLVIPAEIIRDLVGSKGDIQRIIIVASEQGEAAKEQAAGLARAQAAWGGSLSVAGGALELSLYAVNGSGLQVKAESFAVPVAVSFSYGWNGAAQAEQMGIYYWNEATELPEYVRSTRDAAKSVLTASLDHPGIYMPLVYDKTYADVPSVHWASKAIRGLTAAHVAEGDDSGRFAPDRAVSRAEFVILLARLLDLEKKSSTVPLSKSSFADVSPADYYAQAVEAVRKAGIADGRGEGSFAPDAVITREEMVVLLARAIRFAGYGLPSGGEVSGGSGFADAAAVSPWALPDVEAAAAAGWLGGYEDGSFRPQGSATRAEAAQLLWKLGEVALL
ncbi:MAG: alpha amylase catalytic region [Paenibacillaceae bacterium]|nr:alpha amylase catalytic region [Paenibacillaceae bacterium]